MNLETFWKDANWPSRWSIRVLVHDIVGTFTSQTSIRNEQAVFYYVIYSVYFCKIACERSSFRLFPEMIQQDVVPSGEAEIQELPDSELPRLTLGVLTWICHQTIMVVMVVLVVAVAVGKGIFVFLVPCDGKPWGYISTPEVSVYGALWIPWETPVWPRCTIQKDENFWESRAEVAAWVGFETRVVQSLLLQSFASFHSFCLSLCEIRFFGLLMRLHCHTSTRSHSLPSCSSTRLMMADILTGYKMIQVFSDILCRHCSEGRHFFRVVMSGSNGELRMILQSLSPSLPLWIRARI